MITYKRRGTDGGIGVSTPIIKSVNEYSDELCLINEQKTMDDHEISIIGI